MNYLSQNRNIKNGFTLLEVVVALAILGIGLTVIIELFSGGLRLVKTSEEYTKAITYAHMKMEEISLKPPLDEGTEEGKFDEIYRWQVGVKKWNLLPVEKEGGFKPPAELFKVKLSITWKSGSKERTIDIESFKTIKPEDHENKS